MPLLYFTNCLFRTVLLFGYNVTCFCHIKQECLNMTDPIMPRGSAAELLYTHSYIRSTELCVTIASPRLLASGGIKSLLLHFKTQYLSVRDLMCMHLYISIMSFIESNSQRLDKTVGSKHTHTNTKKHLAACYKQAECLCLCL